MSAKHWSAVAPFDPATGLLPAPLEALWSRTGEPGHLLILSAGTGDQREGWAARAAIALATARAAQGVQVLLADLGLESPSLHHELGEENLEGVADIFQFGASLRRVARVLPAHGILFLPTGAYIPDAYEILADPIWDQLLAQLAEEQTCLLAFLPVSTPGVAQLARRFDSVIVLGEGDEADAALDVAGGSDREFALVLHPPAVSAPEPETSTAVVAELDQDPIDDPEVSLVAAADPTLAADAAVAEVEPVELSSETELELIEQPTEEAADPAAPSAESTAESVAEPGHDSEGEELLLHEPPPVPRSARKRRRGASPVLWLLLLVAVAFGGWTLLEERGLLPEWAKLPDRSGQEVEAAPEPVEETAIKSAVPAEPAEPIESPLPYSVAVEAHQDYATAEERVLTLRRREPGITFYLSPTENQGVIYHRVLAGPVADTLAARKLLERLVAARHKTDLDTWNIRPTVWAFHLGDFESRGEAEERMEELRAQQIPSYLVEVEYTAGPPRYRVYIGAFEGPAPADILAPRLKEAGLDLPLVRRFGKPIQ